MAKPKIIDEFTDLPVSHQRKAQLRIRAKGLCVICFKRPIVSCLRCEPCNLKLALAGRKRRPLARRNKSRWLDKAEQQATSNS